MTSHWCSFACNRNALVALNVLYIFIAFILIGTSTYAQANLTLVNYNIIGGIIACGVFLLLIALIGLLATGLHHQVTLFVYMLALILLFVVQFSVACACLALNKNHLESLFVQTWNKSANDYSRKSMLQNTYSCCGANKEGQKVLMLYGNETEIAHPPCMNITGCGNVTEMCCSGRHNDSEECTQSSCWDSLSDDLCKYIRIVGVVGLIFSFAELIGTKLAYGYRNRKNPSVNPNAFL